MEEKIPTVKDGGDNEKKPPAVKAPTEIAMKLIMESMGYSPDSCHPEVVNKLKDVMKVHKELQEVVKKHPPTLQHVLGKSALRIKDGREFDCVYGLGDVACRKDSAAFLSLQWDREKAAEAE
eukprot:scaffold21465_cov66-Skeletonema_marinoi.AAC.1